MPASLLVLSAITALGFYLWYRRQDDSARIVAASQALFNGDFDRAEMLARTLLKDQPDDAAALLIAGEASSRLGRFDVALSYYRRLPDSSDDQVLSGHIAAADMQVRLLQWEAAEATLRKVIATEPERSEPYLRLAHLLSLEGRHAEAEPNWLAALRLAGLSVSELLDLAGMHEPVNLPDVKRNDDRKQAALLLAHGCRAMDEHNFSDAQRFFEEVVQSQHPILEAQVRLGLIQLDTPGGFEHWRERLPVSAEKDARIWAIYGTWLRVHERKKEAVRCFWEAVRRDPNHAAANYQLAQLLELEGRHDWAGAFAERTRKLDALSNLLGRVAKEPMDARLLVRAAVAMEVLGCLWEAWGFAQAALKADVSMAEAEALLLGIGPKLSPNSPRTIPTANPALAIDLSSYSLPGWNVSAPLAFDGASRDRTNAIQFRDATSEIGLSFEYFNGHDPLLGGLRTMEFGGGGVAILDFDADGWPDLYFTQGCAWPPEPGQSRSLDRLFWNRDGRCCDATLTARIVEDRFSQGAAVGDYNSDGFDDLYVANAGTNRLLMNNGDGTFSDVSVIAGMSGKAWTTSCVLADVTGDGLPDIYDVNYLTGDDLYEHVCYDEGKPRACLPNLFSPAPDLLLVNRGDGSFTDASERSGVKVQGGNGLGIVAADFNESRRLSLFVANDLDANFFFVNQTTAGGPRFSEQAIVRGLAFDGLGRAQACMGIGAGDANGDGRLDLFVTNYYREANTLYLAGDDGLYTDASAASGLADPSYAMLGFGTQFVDAQLDGLPDLVVANGHLEDRTDEGIPYAMRPQMFENVGRGKFVELLHAGDYFGRLLRGRGLSRLDFNRDGREDFAVSHLDSPAALVLNQSAPAGRFLALRLRGTKSARDAIGSTVKVLTDETQPVQYRQLTAGDGYMASNQRQVTVGIGGEAQIRELVVEWPSGVRQVWRNVVPDRELIVVEGRDELIVVP